MAYKCPKTLGNKGLSGTLWFCNSIAFRILEDHEDAKEIVNDTYRKTRNTIPPNRPDPLKPGGGTVYYAFSTEK